MVAFVVTALVCFITYLLLTIGSANNASFLNLWMWSIEEIIFGLVLSILVGIIARKVLEWLKQILMLPIGLLQVK